MNHVVFLILWDGVKIATTEGKGEPKDGPVFGPYHCVQHTSGEVMMGRDEDDFHRLQSIPGHGVYYDGSCYPGFSVISAGATAIFAKRQIYDAAKALLPPPAEACPS